MMTKSPYVLTFGETMGLFSAERVGELRSGDPYAFSMGGAESNFAIGLSRLGGKVHWIGRTGTDAFGSLIAKTLRAESVSTTVIADSEAPTGLMVRGKRLPGIAQVSYYRRASAGSRLNPADIPASLVQGAQHLHVTGITPALSDSARAATLHAIELAKTAGIPVSFDVNYRARLWPADEAKDSLIQIAKSANIIFAGTDEATLLTGQEELPLQLEHLAMLGPDQVIIKQGPAGATALVSGVVTSAAGYSIDAVDTVGAGDAFAAGFTYGSISGLTVEDSLTLANRVAAFVCLSAGDWEGFPYLNELAYLDLEEPVIR